MLGENDTKGNEMRINEDTGAPEPCECLEGPEGCEGEVAYRTTSDRTDGKSFPRCVKHWEARQARAADILEMTSPIPAPWFDPSYAGESWDEDY